MNSVSMTADCVYKFELVTLITQNYYDQNRNTRLVKVDNVQSFKFHEFCYVENQIERKK